MSLNTASTVYSMASPSMSCSPSNSEKFECSTNCTWFCDTNGSICLDYYIGGGVILLAVSVCFNILYIILIIVCKIIRKKNRSQSATRGNDVITHPLSHDTLEREKQKDQRNMLEFQYMPPERTLDYDQIQNQQYVSEGFNNDSNNVTTNFNHGGHLDQHLPHPDHHVSQQPLPNGKFKSSYDMISACYIDDQGDQICI